LLSTAIIHHSDPNLCKWFCQCCSLRKQTGAEDIPQTAANCRLRIVPGRRFGSVKKTDKPNNRRDPRGKEAQSSLYIGFLLLCASPAGGFVGRIYIFGYGMRPVHRSRFSLNPYSLMSSQPAGFYGTYFANSRVGIHIL
jgi:hypothetical protein